MHECVYVCVDVCVSVCICVCLRVCLVCLVCLCVCVCSSVGVSICCSLLPANREQAEQQRALHQQELEEKEAEEFNRRITLGVPAKSPRSSSNRPPMAAIAVTATTSPSHQLSSVGPKTTGSQRKTGNERTLSCDEVCAIQGGLR